MKRITVILFSLVLIYGGVAWALEKCLDRHDHHEHSSQARDAHRHDSTFLSDYRDPLGPIIHCPSAQMRIGPAAQSGSAHLNRGRKVTTVHAPLFYQPASPTCKSSLWLDAVFRRDLAFSRPDDLGRHLLLSVLQI